MTQQTKGGRPKGSRNAKPSRKALDAYYRLLQTKADEGDTTAAGWLCQLDLIRREGGAH